MKNVAILFILIALGSCKAEQKNTPESTSKNEAVKKVEIETESVTEIATDEQVDYTKDVALLCKFEGEDEYGIPRNTVFLVTGNEKQTVGKCLACSEITKKEYDAYNIPQNALSACGGWWAGGGDYFYVVVDENGKVDVYQGWQDEGEEEVSKDPFHWKISKTITIKH